MESPRLLIIGLDGLEYTLVTRWNLLQLQQDFHGKFHVGDISRLYTPLIWSSILCGFNVEEKGYDYESAVKKSMGKLGPLHVIKRHLFGEKRRMWLARTVFKKLGLLKPPNFIMPEQLLKETFLEEIRKTTKRRVTAIEVPGYNERINGVFRLEMTRLAVTGNTKAKAQFITKVKNDALTRLERAREQLQSHDLVMCYIALPDLSHHLFFRGITDKIRILELYKWLENNVGRILLDPAYEASFNVIILSDHGFNMKELDHSSYGFWSTNFPAEIYSYQDVKKRILNLFELRTYTT